MVIPTPIISATTMKRISTSITTTTTTNTISPIAMVMVTVIRAMAML